MRHSRNSDISFVAVALLRDRRAAATRHVDAAIRARARTRAGGATRAARLARRGRALTGRESGNSVAHNSSSTRTHIFFQLFHD